jgi:hypothetical protein
MNRLSGQAGPGKHYLQYLNNGCLSKVSSFRGSADWDRGKHIEWSPTRHSLFLHTVSPLICLDMAAPSLPAVLRGEQSAVQQELQQLRIDLQNEVQQARADFSIEIQKVQTDLQKLRVEVVPELMRV